MLKKFIYILAGAIVLLFIGIYNGYPLFFSDSGTYIYSGFEKFVPYDRPITYGLFVFFFSLKKSLWFVVFIQNLITSYVLYEALSLLLAEKFSNFRFLLITSLLTFLSGIGWYSNQIMPDFFTPVFILSLLLILFHPKATRLQQVLWYGLVILGGISHFSHLLIGLVVLVIYYVLQLILVNKKVIGAQKLALKKVLIGMSAIILSWFIVPTINYAVEGEFAVSKGSHAFLMAHLADNGMLNKFLKENCDKPEYAHLQLCNYTDKIPATLAGFLWDNNSVFENTGSWEGSKEEYQIIINANLTKPKYLFWNVLKSSTYGLIQFTKFDLGDGLSPYEEWSPPHQQIKKNFSDQLNSYSNSRQNKWGGVGLSFTVLNYIQRACVIFSVIFLLWLFCTPLYKVVNQKGLMLLLFILLSVFINAMILGGLNAPADRFQARVMWLMPLVVFVFIYTNWAEIKKALKSNA